MLKAGENYSLSFCKGLLSLATKKKEDHVQITRPESSSREKLDCRTSESTKKCHMPTRPSKQKVKEN